MLYQYENKYYIRVSNRFYEVTVEKAKNGTFNVVPNKDRKYIEHLEMKPNLESVTVEQAYKKSHEVKGNKEGSSSNYNLE